MAIPVWPAELPQRVLVEGYSERTRDGRLFSATSAGPPKVRRRFSAAVMPVAAAIYASWDQKARFERFWAEDTSGGTLPFIMPDQSRDQVPLLASSGESLTTESGITILIVAKWLALFAREPPQITPMGVRFRISFQLEILP